MAKRKSDVSAAKKAHYEFGGPLGAFGVSFGLPIVCYLFAFLCNDVSGCPAPSALHPFSLNLEKLKQDVGWRGPSTLLNVPAFAAALGWYLWSLTLYALLPATEAKGSELRTGGRLNYRFNAFPSAVFTCVVLLAGTLLQGAEFVVWTFIWDNFIPLLTSNIIIAAGLATFVYVKSFRVKQSNKEMRELALGGASGNLLYDWFIGRELNPRVALPFFGEVDIKIWMELRPGMLGWLLFDFAFAARQYRNYGFVSDAMILSTASQVLYVFDALYMEPAILTTIDIISDGFGFMLAFGDLVWVPFTYSLQTHYLAVHPVQLGPYMAVVFAVFGVGYYIFRSSNNEKNRFRTDPNDPKIKHLEYIETKAGSRLLTSGWWGRARHINYFGDWIMSWAYCMPTGLAGYIVLNNPGVLGVDGRTSASVGSPIGPVVLPGEAAGWGMAVTYFYMLYFAILLIHRERRDEEKCKAKYGKDWDRYCEIVPYRIVPYVY